MAERQRQRMVILLTLAWAVAANLVLKGGTVYGFGPTTIRKESLASCSSSPPPTPPSETRNAFMRARYGVSGPVDSRLDASMCRVTMETPDGWPPTAITDGTRPAKGPLATICCGHAGTFHPAAFSAWNNSIESINASGSSLGYTITAEPFGLSLREATNVLNGRRLGSCRRLIAASCTSASARFRDSSWTRSSNSAVRSFASAALADASPIRARASARIAPVTRLPEAHTRYVQTATNTNSPRYPKNISVWVDSSLAMSPEEAEALRDKAARIALGLIVLVGMYWKWCFWRQCPR
jgi:hypothetical protein